MSPCSLDKCGKLATQPGSVKSGFDGQVVDADLDFTRSMPVPIGYRNDGGLEEL